jgi:hypothetical protein
VRPSREKKRFGWLIPLRAKTRLDPDPDHENEYREKLDQFEARHGELIYVYWATEEASAVAVTLQTGIAHRLGWRRRGRPSGRFHQVSDWATKDVSDIADLFYRCDALAIRASEVLRGTSQRIALLRVGTIASRLLGFVDSTKGKPTTRQVKKVAREQAHELRNIERYYHRAAFKAARIVYTSGMMVGLVFALGLLWVLGVLFGRFEELRDEASQIHTLYACYTAGALGAFVSVLSRMASSRGKFDIDYEVGRPKIFRLGSYRPFIGAVFGVVIYFAFQGGLIQISAPNPAHSFYFFTVVAFAAGFSERATRLIIDPIAEQIAAKRAGFEPAATEDSVSPRAMVERKRRPRAALSA